MGSLVSQPKRGVFFAETADVGMEDGGRGGGPWPCYPCYPPVN